MGRKLTFRDVKGDEFVGEIDKLKRDELYGWSEIEAFDEDGNLCKLVSVADDGKTLFGPGGYNFADINEAEEFVDSKELVAVDSENKPLKVFESSFKSGIDLIESATTEEFLSHQVKSVYQLSFSEISDLINQAIKEGTIFQFDFSYRGGTSLDKGFVLANGTGDPFLILSTPSDIEFLTFTDAVSLESENEDESDIFDFGSL